MEERLKPEMFLTNSCLFEEHRRQKIPDMHFHGRPGSKNIVRCQEGRHATSLSTDEGEENKLGGMRNLLVRPTPHNLMEEDTTQGHHMTARGESTAGGQP